MNAAVDPGTIGRLYKWHIIVSTLLIFSSFAYSAPTLNWVPLPGYLFVMGIAAVTVFFGMGHLRGGIRLTPLLIWAYGTIVFATLWMFVGRMPNSSLIDYWKLLCFMVLLFAFYSLFETLEARRVALKCVLLATLIAIVVTPVQLGMGFTRPGGMYLNANAAGFALVMGMILTSNLISPRWRFPYQLAVLVGVFATLSRSSIVLWAGSMFLLYLFGRDRASQSRWLFAGILMVALFAMSPYGTDLLDTFRDNAPEADRILTLESTNDLQNDSRAGLAKLAWEEVAKHPFIGHGTGHDEVFSELQYWATHNIYLSVMMQFGVLGLVIPLSLVAILLGQQPARWAFSLPLAAFLVVGGFFEHAYFEQWHYALVYALVVRMTGAEFTVRKPASQATAPSTYALAPAAS